MTGPPGPGPAPAPRRRERTVRGRLLALMTGLMALGLALTGGVSYGLQYASLADRVDAELQQEVDELGLMAQAGPAGDGEPFTDVDALFLTFLNTAVPAEDEAIMGLVDGRPVYVSGGERRFDVSAPELLAAVRAAEVGQGRSSTFELKAQGTDLRVLVADVRLPGETREGRFVVANDVGRQEADVARRALTYAALSVATVALAALLGHLLLSRLLRPLRDLREAAAVVTTEDLTRRVEVPGADTDVAELALRFNQMLDRIADGVSQQRQFLDDAAHELRTPLTILRGNAELLQEGDPEEVRATRTLLLDEVDRMQRLVDDLLMLARSQRPDFLRPAPTDVAELAVASMERLTTLGERAWRLRADAEGELRVDRQRVLQAVVQLAANAVRFSERGSAVELFTRWEEDGSPGVAEARAAGARPARRYLALGVRDEGRGIAPEDQARVFERFARADGVAQVDGSGLGLPIVRAVAEAHGGAVTLDSAEGAGSTFTLWLPDGELPG